MERIGNVKPESLVQLIGSGNTAIVEEEWMRLMESPDRPLHRLAEYDVVLRELCRTGQNSRAEAFAWAAIEMISGRSAPMEALTVAGPFLLAVGESEDLRAQIVELYRSAYADREGFEALLAESGLAGGRPVRRALRTLDVCLSLKEGDFLAPRDEDEAARIEKIDRTAWQFTITGPECGPPDRSGPPAADFQPVTIGAVHLADRYRPASPTEFRVMRQFTPNELAKRLWDDPVSIVIELCRQHNNSVDSHRIEATLVPDLLTEADWKKWWTRARTALKRCPHVKIEGRSPYYLSYVEQPIALEGRLLEELEGTHDPLARLELVEKYLRECKARRQEPCHDTLHRCYGDFVNRAEQLTAKVLPQAGLWWVVARRVVELAGLKDEEVGSAVRTSTINFFKTATNLDTIFAEIENNLLLDLACTCLVEARPDDWHQPLSTLLPTFPLAACDRIARRLVDGGWGLAEFEPIVQTIMGSPVAHFEALLWLWDGPSQAEHLPVPAPVTLLSRIVRALGECRRSDSISRETAKKIGTRARAVLSARKYERFNRCLNELEPGMAIALQNQVRQLDNLGRVVREELLTWLRRRFPSSESKREVLPWSRDDVLYVTEAGMARKQEEIDDHVHVKMRKNAEAIGRAAEHGDLSENSEYKFALEERDLLRARLAQMNAEMASARVISPDDIPTDHVGIGTKAIFQRITDGERYELSFVGPWEADPKKGWFNYQAPFARKVLGQRVGDIVEFGHSGAVGTYEIVALENALAPSG